MIRPTIMLGSGNYFDYENPEATPLTIDDLAYGLASASRFAGQCVSTYSGRRVRYNVAEHCVRMSFEVEVCPEAEPEDAYDALMHELGEPTCGDMTGPLKSIVPSFKAIEKRCERAGLVVFGVPMRDPALIKRFDLRMLATEKRDLIPHAGVRDNDTHRIEPFDSFRIVRPWEFDEAAERFIDRYHQLRHFARAA